MYPDPTPVKARTIAIAVTPFPQSCSTRPAVTYTKMFLLSTMTGMNYNVSDDPAELQSRWRAPIDPVEMSRLFCAGAEWARCGMKWRHTAGYEPGEGAKYRAGQC